MIEQVPPELCLLAMRLPMVGAKDHYSPMERGWNYVYRRLRTSAESGIDDVASSGCSNCRDSGSDEPDVVELVWMGG